MAAGARCRADGREVAPEKIQSLAEERFLAGNVAAALQAVQEYQARSRTPLPTSLSHDLAAYKVHAAAAASRSGGANWYAVLGFGAGARGAATREDIKRRYRRLCLVLHPDKNRSAAADGAFKLLQEAWAALSARHPPPPPPSAEKQRANQPAASDTSNSDSRKPQPTAPPPRTFRSVYCARCRQGFRAPGGEHEVKHCGLCNERLKKPRRHAPAGAEAPPPRGGNRIFSRALTCPVPGCRGQYIPCMVTVELWQLRCMLCRHQPRGPPMPRDDLLHLHDLYTKTGSARFKDGGVYSFP